MQAMSYWLYIFLSCSFRFNIYETAVHFTMILRLTVLQVEICSIHIPKAILDSNPFNTLMQEVMISSKFESVCVGNWSNLTLQRIFDTWWACMNRSSMCAIVWNSSGDGTAWHFYMHCRFKVTGSPGSVCIIYHQVLCHPLEMGLAQWEYTC